MTPPHTVVRILLRKRNYSDGSRSSVGVPFLRSLNNRTIEVYVGEETWVIEEESSTFVMDPLGGSKSLIQSIA
jgi:hypothetical protein